MSPKHLYGIHDPGGEALMADAPGTIVYTVNVAEDTPVDFGALAERGFRALVRLNHSHNGAGTIPPNAADWPRFAETCALFVAGCRGVRDFTLGNEPNLAVEWGRPEPVMPEQYAACYNLVHRAVKARKPSAQLAPAAIGPWNVESGIEWIDYFQRMLEAISQRQINFICLHAYSRGYSPQSITDNSWMDAPHQNRHSGFRAYKDFLDAIPPALRSVPVDIKESNGNEPWPDANTGWVQAAYAEIHRHNGIVGTQKIRTLAMFRWASFDTRWDFSTKNGVHADLRAAVAHRYAAPTSTIAAQPTPQPTTVNLPTVSAGQVATLPNRDWDERLTARGVSVQPANVQPGHAYWRVVGGKWFNEQESGGRYHIYARVLDEQGRVVSGVPLRVNWPDGEHRLVTEDKPSAEWVYPANFPMGRSLSEFSLRVDDGTPSEIVSGIGRGADGNPNIHTSTLVTFQRATWGISQPPPPSNTVNIPTVTVGPARLLYVTAPEGLFLRKEPTTDADIVARLPHGTGVEVSVKRGDWWSVSGGWAHGDWLSPTKPEPVVEPTVPTEPGNVDQRVLQAILNVESGGNAVGADGRVIIRFENHIFLRRHNAHQYFRHSQARPWEGHEWRRDPNGSWQPVHTGAQSSAWNAYEFAASLNREAATESISMGAPQIMGFHYRKLGFASATAMLQAFRNPQTQIVAFFVFILNTAGLLDAIKRKDWRAIAHGYNGAGNVDYAAGKYREAYERLRG